MKNKVLFFSMPKTGSTSWNAALLKISNTISLNHDKRKPGWKDPKYFKDIDNYWAFTFIRNPIDRFVSAFNYLKEGGINKEDRIESSLLIDKKYKDDISSWVIDVLDKNQIVLTQLHFRPQHEWIFDKDKTQFNLFKYENQSRAIYQVSSILNIDLKVPTLNKTPNKDGCLNEEALNILKRIYQKDFDIWESL
jgi:hypothetical protein